MANTSLVPIYVFLAVMSIGMLWPDNSDKPLPGAPKKGFWQAADLFWPIRRVYGGLRSSNLKLRRSSRNAITLAAGLTIWSDILMRVMKISDSSAQTWWFVDCGIVIFLIGRASGFWSADRRLRREDNKASPKSAATFTDMDPM